MTIPATRVLLVATLFVTSNLAGFEKPVKGSHDALEQLGRDTSSADAEIELILRRGTPVQGGVRAPEPRGKP